MNIITNNHPRDVIEAWELDGPTLDKIKKEFDYIAWDDVESGTYNVHFFQYKGELYDLDEFQPTSGYPADSPLREWSGYISDTFFSGVLIKWANEDMDKIVVGRFYT